MEVQNYISTIKEMHVAFLDYIDCEEGQEEENYENIINNIEKNKIGSDEQEFQLVIRMLAIIIKNHHVSANFYKKIEKIILYFKDILMKYFNQRELFGFFECNKKILLFLINEKIINVDDNFVQIITSDEYKNKKYNNYFFPEIKPFLKEFVVRSMTKKYNINFDEDRSIGQNNDKLLKLIRDDLLDEFIEYAKKRRISLTKAINNSIFETNALMVKKNCISLTNYAAFFGAAKILKYLLQQNVKKDESLWIYAIYSDNLEVIHLLEKENIQLNDDSYKKFLKEAIKCHHNEIANYIIKTYLPDEDNNLINSNAIKYCNFSFIQKDYENVSFFNDLCIHDYYHLVLHMIKSTNIDLNHIIKTKSDEKTFLYTAIENDNKDIVQALLTSDKIDVNLQSIISNQMFKSHLKIN